jgi:hypothetical protein
MNQIATNIGSPEEYAESLFKETLQYDDLGMDDVRRICRSTLTRLYQAVDEPMKTYYREAIHYINKKGGGK